MNNRDKDKIKALISEAKVWADENKDYLTGLDGDCEEISVECLTLPDVKMLLENLEKKLLMDDEPELTNNKSALEYFMYRAARDEADIEMLKKKLHELYIENKRLRKQVNGLVEKSKKPETPKPCPYCGKPPVQTAVHRTMDWDGYKLECTNPRCPEPLHTLECPTERIAVYAWNHGPRFNERGKPC